MAADTRIILLEDDLDTLEATGDRLAAAIEKASDRVNLIILGLMGSSLTFVVASILVAIDIGRGR